MILANGCSGKVENKKAVSEMETAFLRKIEISVRCEQSSRGNHVHAAAVLVEEHPAIDQSEERVIPATTDSESRMDLGAALADDDVSGDDGLATELLHAEALAAGVASVFNGALSFFMGHKSG